MIPNFLRPETWPYASIEIIPAAPVVTYLLHVRHPSGVEQTLAFATAAARGFALIPMVKLPVALRVSEVIS
jgi:hypothetical protein